MFFDSWNDLLRVLVVGTLAYAALVLLLRVSGKRTLSKWNAFDFIVTIALGSTLATVLLSKQVSYVEGAVGLALLVLLQFTITRLSLRSALLRRIVKADPVFLYRNGEFCAETLHHERVTEAEVRAAVRGVGIAAMEDVQAVVLETDGSVSVIKGAASQRASALIDVR